MIQVSNEDQHILELLRRAVAETLERKRRLGQYAVVWRDGQPAIIGGETDPSRPALSTTPNTITPKD